MFVNHGGKETQRADRNLTGVARKSAFWGNAWKSNPLKQQRHATFASPPGKPFSQYLFWRMTIDWMLMTLDSIRLFRSRLLESHTKDLDISLRILYNVYREYFKFSVVSTQEFFLLQNSIHCFGIIFMLIFKSSSICIYKKKNNFIFQIF